MATFWEKEGGGGGGGARVVDNPIANSDDDVEEDEEGGGGGEPQRVFGLQSRVDDDDDDDRRSMVANNSTSLQHEHSGWEDESERLSYHERKRQLRLRRRNAQRLFGVFVILAIAAPLVLYFDNRIANSDDAQVGITHWVCAAQQSSGECDFDSLVDALGAVTSGDTLWITAGTYYPTTSSDRTASFAIPAGVSLFGGFDGTETSLDERTFAERTILSGDIGVQGDMSDNSYHVVIGSEGCLVDGVTITGGNADAEDGLDAYGGGWLNDSPDEFGFHNTISNVHFSGNRAREGGGLYNWNTASPDIMNCLFEDNHAFGGDYVGGNGGAVVNRDGCTPEITDCLFKNNRARDRGGALYNDYGSSMTCRNCVFEDNWTGGDGGGAYADDRASQWGATSPAFYNCVFSRNTAERRGGGMANYNRVTPFLDNITFTMNTAGVSGGAISNRYGVTVSYADNAVTSLHFDHTNSAGDGSGEDYGVVEPPFFSQDCMPSSTDTASCTFPDNAPVPLLTASYETLLAELYAQKYDEDPASSNAVVFVDGESSCATACDGSTWENAFPTIQDGINSAYVAVQSGTAHGNVEVWVTMGQYVPTFARPNAWDADPVDCANRNDPIKCADCGQVGGECHVVDCACWADPLVDQATYEYMRSNCALTCPNIDLRLASIHVLPEVSIFGGFTPGMTSRDQRHWSANPTILSGNISDSDAVDDNAIHVVWAENRSVVDGFVITGGFADDTGYDSSGGTKQHTTPTSALEMSAMTTVGGGFVAREAQITLRNSVVYENFAFKAGGLYFLGSITEEPTLNNPHPGAQNPATDTSFITNVAVAGNVAVMRGGGTSLDLMAYVSFDRCIFDANAVGAKGGAQYNDFYCSPNITSSVYRNNFAEVAGGAMGNDGSSSPIITDSVFIGNYANDLGAGLEQGSFNGTKLAEGLVTSCSPMLINCTVNNNKCDTNPDIFNWHLDIPVLLRTCVNDTCG